MLMWVNSSTFKLSRSLEFWTVLEASLTPLEPESLRRGLWLTTARISGKMWVRSWHLRRRREDISGYSSDVGEYKVSMVKVKTLSPSVAMWASKTQPEERNKVSDRSLGWDQLSLGWQTPHDEDCYSYESSEYNNPVQERFAQASSHNGSDGTGTDSEQWLN